HLPQIVENVRQDLIQSLAVLLHLVVAHTDSFPIFPNGKVRDELLLDPGEEIATKIPPQDENSTQDEKNLQIICRCFSESLGLPKVQPSANFFSLGGHSLALFKLSQLLFRELGVQ